MKQINKQKLWELIFKSIPEAGVTFPDGYEEWIDAPSYREDVITNLQQLKSDLITTEIVSKQSYQAGYKQAVHDLQNKNVNNSFELKDNNLKMDKLWIRIIQDKPFVAFIPIFNPRLYCEGDIEFVRKDK